MSNVDGHEDEINYVLHRIESMIAARTEAGHTREALEEKEAALEERETLLLDREASLAERERLVQAREEAVARRENIAQINPPPPPVPRPARAVCDHCGRGVCSRSSACYDEWGRDNHTHGCSIVLGSGRSTAAKAAIRAKA